MFNTSMVKSNKTIITNYKKINMEVNKNILFTIIGFVRSVIET